MDWIKQDWEFEAQKDQVYLLEDRYFLEKIEKKPAIIKIITLLKTRKYESRNKLTSLRRNHKEGVQS
jgi:hypothetical protein